MGQITDMEPDFISRDDLDPNIVSALNQNSRGVWFLGNKDLLKRDGISFCGSRRASETGLETARCCAVEAVKLGAGTVSGNALGVDLHVHGATLESGGWSIFVLAEGIANFRIKKAFANVWDWDRCLVISQYEPGDRWQVWRAMERNNLIIALGIAMIVIEAGETGGTREAARQTMKAGKPLFAVTYENSVPGNDAIINEGAKLLGRHKDTGRPNIAKVLNSADSHLQKDFAAQQPLPL